MTSEIEALRGLIEGARVVLWDFDGPICTLFAGHPSEEMAAGFVHWLDRIGLGDLLTETERKYTDPQAVLHAVNRRRPGSDLVVEMEKRLTEEEMKAVSTAMPTPFADPLIRTWQAVGSRLAITTNNSPQVVRAYLENRGMLSCFAPHIYGRTQDLSLLKPDPHCLNRALSAMGAAPSEALMIGDAPSDYSAAVEAEVPFLGYARNAAKQEELREAGVEVLVGSLQPLHRLLWHSRRA
ncbi:HAD family hydrolase [Streptomyces sp. YU58]|uniref:HAD family hydrolase n=1 Tax=Streptomyces sp. SX92 TaxID=3158972 RepID=UPI0027B91063|nr:HAD family hydrolase [Streptomyces coralus]WLW54024.1 HAD hydrolase-like protein [Streptomyces coralus]